MGVHRIRLTSPAIVRRNRRDHDHYFLAKSPPLLVGNADLGVQRLRALHKHGHLLLVVAAIHGPTDVADVAAESQAGGTHNTPPTSFLSIRSLKSFELLLTNANLWRLTLSLNSGRRTEVLAPGKAHRMQCPITTQSHMGIM